MTEEKLPTQDADALGEMPDPKIEPGEPNPGGADALPDDAEALPADLDPEKSAATEPEVPEVLKESQDTDTEATKNGEDVSPEDESPA